MRNLTVRPAWLATLAVAVAATGIGAGAGNAAPAGKPSYPPRAAKFPHPKLKQGVLAIRDRKSVV